MGGLNFRDLRADEIEVRPQKITAKGLIALLYKNARCDMNILDEAVSPAGWQRRHYDCKGNLFCSVGILCDGEWVWKDDAGAESNMERQKGEASDSFKRACTNWGIGRALYTSPFIWIAAGKYETYEKENKLYFDDHLSVVSIQYKEGRISYLQIANKQGEIVFEYGHPAPTVVLCPSCNKVVKAGNKPGGGQLTPQQVVDVYGMCAACAKKDKGEGQDAP